MTRVIMHELNDVATAPRHNLTLGQTYKLSIELDSGGGWQRYSIETVLRMGPFMQNTTEAQDLILRTLFDPLGQRGLSYDAFDRLTPDHMRVYITGDVFYICSSSLTVRVRRIESLSANEIDLFAAFTDLSEDSASYSHDGLVSTWTLSRMFGLITSTNQAQDAYTIFVNGKLDGAVIFPIQLFFDLTQMDMQAVMLSWLVTLNRYFRLDSVSGGYQAVGGKVIVLAVDDKLVFHVASGHTFTPLPTEIFNGQKYIIDRSRLSPTKYRLDAIACLSPFRQDSPPLPDNTGGSPAPAPAVVVPHGPGLLNSVALAMALRAQIDQSTGWHKSISNVVVPGPTGISKPVTWQLNQSSNDAGYLNGHDVTTLIQHQGFRFWGNRTTSADPRFAFEVYTRTAHFLLDTIINGLFPFVDQPLTIMLARDIIDTINAKLRAEVKAGHLIGASVWYDPQGEGNSIQDLQQGRFWIDYDYTPVPPLEQLGLRQRITSRYLVDFGKLITGAA